LLSALVTSANGKVNAGTVTFTVLHGSTVIGSATTSSTVTSGNAGASYSLPASTAAGSHIIEAVYNASDSFATSSDGTHTLAVNTALQTISFSAPTSPMPLGVSPITLVATGGS